MISSKKLLILVDGSAHLYRSHYIFSSLKNHLGEPIGVVYGVLKTLRDLLIRYNPEYIITTFDSSKETFRKKIYKKYKSCRPSMPSQIVDQIPLLFSIIQKIGIPLLTIKSFEADDIIGTFAVLYVKKGFNVLINTCDKDISQLVSSNISIIDMFSGKIFGKKEVKLRFGVPSELIVDFIALSGDRTDNIPGIPGIGKKTAQILLSNIGGLKKIYRKVYNSRIYKFPVSNSIIEKLKKYRNLAFLSYKLAKIKTDININLLSNNSKIKKIDPDLLNYFFEKNMFKKLEL